MVVDVLQHDIKSSLQVLRLRVEAILNPLVKAHESLTIDL